MTNLTSAGYVTQDKDGYAIWATGSTVSEAEAATAEIAMDGDLSGFNTYPATAALIAKVEAEGGQIGWDIVSGIACTREEAEEAEAAAYERHMQDTEY